MCGEKNGEKGGKNVLRNTFIYSNYFSKSDSENIKSLTLWTNQNSPSKVLYIKKESLSKVLYKKKSPSKVKMGAYSEFGKM